jgi:hypothetical protein
MQGEQVGAAGFSADGSLLAVGDRTGRVALRDGHVSRRANVLRNVFPTPLGDIPDAGIAVAVSPDGTTLKAHRRLRPQEPHRHGHRAGVAAVGLPR